ncbi:hypothetical protein D1646_17130 [Pseudoflavonifractor sp. 60]|uniref:hypothetical protein n=1 Tax=Pseudoflavonifractor sp. 60 TaxID=2304576 RepID=UPI001369EA1A|nr:hypothetical protein [Pseudoflavonifractor sp. 60]NBI68479.1 hypothetical protein [Pseudoflavonifractor sp. 60]
MDEFDRLLYANSQLPPELTQLEPPRPWKKPIGQICWGLALITITLNFLGLNIILPAAGTVLLWLGLRTLRRENGGFRFAYACAVLYAALRLTAVLFQATPLDHWLASLIGREWNTSTGPVPLYYALWTVLIQLVLVLAAGGLWQGLKGVFIQAGQKPRTAAAGGLVILEALMLPMALIGLEGWLLVGPILILWVCLIMSLRKVSRSLDQAGYALKAAPVRVSGGLALWLWLGLHLLMIAALPLLFSRLPTNIQMPTPVADSNSTIRAQLLELGFPEDILAGLDDSELARFEGAYGLKKSGYRSKDDEFPDGMPEIITVEVPVRDERYGFHTVYLAYLYWTPNEASGGYMEGIQVAQDYQGVTVRTTVPDGVLKWQDRAGNACAIPLEFWREADSAGRPCCYANFSLPKDVSGPMEGFLFWEAMPSFPETVSVYNFSVTAAHRRSFWQYPYTLPSEILASGFYPPSWQWRMYRWTSEGQLAPEGMYDPRKY